MTVNEPNRIANRKAALRWGGFVVGLLALQVLVGVYAIYLATSDPSVAVVPDYYQKALNWDETKQGAADSDRLGWTLKLGPVSANSGIGLRGQILDSNGDVVSIASGTLILYHHSRASEMRVIELPQSEEGQFFIADCLAFDGLWQADVELQSSQGQRFVEKQVVMVDQAVIARSVGE